MMEENAQMSLLPDAVGAAQMTMTGEEEIDHSEYEIVRPEFFAHIKEPALTVNVDKIGVNTACVRLMPDVEYVQISEKDEVFFTALVENKIVVSFEKLRKLAQMDETKLIGIRRKLLREEDVKMRQRKPHKKQAEERTQAEEKKPATPLEVGIKDMPQFDPDMEFRGLALTIPTWINAIFRSRAKTNIKMVSKPTKAQLAVILRRLEEQITQTLEVIEK